MNFLMVFDFTQFWLDGRPGNEYFWISHKIFGHLTPLTPLGVHPQWFETTWNRFERFLLLWAVHCGRIWFILLSILLLMQTQGCQRFQKSRKSVKKNQKIRIWRSSVWTKIEWGFFCHFRSECMFFFSNGSWFYFILDGRSNPQISTFYLPDTFLSFWYHYSLIVLYLISEKSIWKNQVRPTGFYSFSNWLFTACVAYKNQFQDWLLQARNSALRTWLFQLDFSKFK